MANTPFGIVISAEDAVEEKTSDSAPITIPIPATQQMPASTTTPQNATPPFRNVNRGSGHFRRQLRPDQSRARFHLAGVHF